MRRLALALVLMAAAPSLWALRIERLRSALAGGRVMDVVAEQALVRFSSATADHAGALRTLGFSVIGEFSDIGWTQVGLPPGTGVRSGLAVLRGLPGVVAAEPNRAYYPTRVPNDPLFNVQYALSKINAPAGWEFGVGDSTQVTVAFVDTGIDHNQPDLAAKLVNGATASSQYCSAGGAACVSQGAAPTPACNHATRTSGVAAAITNNDSGVAGVSWGARLLSLKVFDDGTCNPAGDCPAATCFTSDASMINAVNYAAGVQNSPDAGRLVLNLSLGCTPDPTGIDCDPSCTAALAAAFAAALAKGIPIVISAGNDGGGVNVPADCAAHPAVIAAGGGLIPAGATDQNDSIASFSSHGAELASYGVVAPGVSVTSTDLGSAFTSAATGTSFSAPHVSGLAALLLATMPTLTPATAAQEVQNWIRGGADQIGVDGNHQGAGRINAFRSMRLAVNGTTAFDGDQKAIAFPNPFRLSQTGAVSFSVPTSLQGANTAIKIYTIGGEYVKTVTGLTWDGRNTAGNPVATGTYIFVVSTDNGTTRGRVAVIR